jgi:hypothetical protein
MTEGPVFVAILIKCKGRGLSDSACGGSAWNSGDTILNSWIWKFFLKGGEKVWKKGGKIFTG